jgi:integrase/recombinase XerD
MGELEKQRRTQNFTKFINQHIKKIAETIGVTTDISTYWARHSFTTNAIRSVASMEFIQESLGHKDMKTTMNYWGGFEESVKRDISEKIMDFE